MGIKIKTYKKLLENLGFSKEEINQEIEEHKDEITNLIEPVSKLDFDIPFDFVEPKKRPRRGKQGNFYSPSSIKEKELADYIKVMLLDEFGYIPGFPNEIKIEIKIFYPGKLRGDLDNYEKFIWDSLEKSNLIRNDRNIVESSVKLIKSEKERFFHVSIEEVL